MEILRILQKSSRSTDDTYLTLKLCQEPFANLAGERYANKAISTLRSVILGKIKKFGKTLYTLPLKAVNPIQITTRRRKRSDSVLLEKTLYQCLEILSKA